MFRHLSVSLLVESHKCPFSRLAAQVGVGFTALVGVGFTGTISLLLSQNQELNVASGPATSAAPAAGTVRVLPGGTCTLHLVRRHTAGVTSNLRMTAPRGSVLRAACHRRHCGLHPAGGGVVNIAWFFEHPRGLQHPRQ